ncbi:MAG: hypothetical protein A4E40_01578 [Methanoregulaceae archaeon PtaU1.Bin059]|nr:MAG: hypothetical protein A4E40_01578 [Methanoregulaceae archaeon PtaU1.Bin059]
MSDWRDGEILIEIFRYYLRSSAAIFCWAVSTSTRRSFMIFFMKSLPSSDAR